MTAPHPPGEGIVNRSIGQKTVRKSSHWAKHGKHGGMRGICAMINRTAAAYFARRRQARAPMIDASRLRELWGAR